MPNSEYQVNYVYPNFAKAAERGISSPWERHYMEDIEKLIPRYSWQTIVSASRSLYANSGIVKSCASQKAYYSIGNAWNPVFKGKNKEWGDKATEWLIEKFYPMCNIKGPMYDFKTSLFINSISLDRDGDFAILLTESKSGFPQLQMISAHRIGQRYNIKDKVEKGPYRGRRINNGVITNEFGRPIAYRILGDDPKKDMDISSRNLIHVFDPSWHEQVRGLPAGMHAISDLLSARKSEEYERMAQLMLSSIGFIEYNDTGMNDPEDPKQELLEDGDGNKTGDVVETFEGGTVKKYRAESGNKIEQVKNDRPGPNWESFHDRIYRSYITGMNWSYALVWKPNDLNGTSQRAEIDKVRRSVQDRQGVLSHPCKRVIAYAVAKGIKLGILEPDEEWYKWGFTMPPKFSIDLGRDSKAQLDGWKAGRYNMSDLISEDGKTLDDHYRQRAHEIARRKQIKEEVEQETGVEIDEREMAMYTPNEQPEKDEEEKDGQ